MTYSAPIVFIVDDDISVRELLELLIRKAGWQSETFETAQEFLSRPHILVPSCLALDLDLTLPGPARSRIAKAVRYRSTSHPNNLHHVSWPHAGDGAGHEGGSCRILNETIQ